MKADSILNDSSSNAKIMILFATSIFSRFTHRDAGSGEHIIQTVIGINRLWGLKQAVSYAGDVSRVLGY